jgi:hypothetical protein
MPKPTLQNVFDAARAHIGADATGGSAVYSNTMLQFHFAKAYRCLFRTMQNLGDPVVEREVYFVLPANSSYFAPSTAGITDFGEPRFVQERGDLTQKTITGASGTTTVTITATSHGFATGDLVTCNGIVGLSGTEGVMWGITVSSANAFVLNGCVGSGTYSSGGVAVKSTDRFRDAAKTDQLDNLELTDRVYQWVWENEALLVNPCTTARQLRVGYLASGDAPTSTSTTIGIDDSLDFLATYTAALAARSRGAMNKYETLAAEALGPSGQEDASGGLLGSFLTAATKAYQRIDSSERRRLPFRDRRPRNGMWW